MSFLVLVSQPFKNLNNVSDSTDFKTMRFQLNVFWVRFCYLYHIPRIGTNSKAHTNFIVETEKIISTIKENCSLFWFYLRGRSKNINKWTWMDPSYQFSFLMKMQGFTLSGGCIPLEHWILSGFKKSAQSHFRN